MAEIGQHAFKQNTEQHLVLDNEHTMLGRVWRRSTHIPDPFSPDDESESKQQAGNNKKGRMWLWHRQKSAPRQRKL
jgi:hypothetical protein